MSTAEQILNSSSKLIVFSLDRQYRYLFFNAQHASVMQQIWGVQIEMGSSMLGYIKDPEDSTKAQRNFDRAMAGEEFSIIEKYGQHAQIRRAYENTYTPLKDASGQITGIAVVVSDVTNTLQDQKQIDEERQLLSSISANIEEGIYRSHPERGLTFGNQSFARIFGYETLDELLSTRGRHLYEDEKVRDELTEKINRNGSFYNERVRFRRKDGTHFWGLMSARKVLTEDGDTYYDGAVRDMTEYIETLDLLKDSESRLQRAQEIGKMGDWEFDVLSGEVKWSQACYTLYGWPKSSPPPSLEEHQQILSPESYDLLVKTVQQVIEKHKPYDIRLSSPLIYGQQRYFRGIGQPILEEGKLVRLVGTVQDITDLQRAEAQRKQSDDLLRKVVDALPEYILVKDANGTIIFANREYAQSCGVDSYKELIGKSVSQLDPGGEGHRINLEEDKRVIKTQQPSFDPEEQFVQSDGTYRYMQVTKLPIELDGNNNYVLVLAQDITSRKKTEDELKANRSIIDNINQNVNEGIYRSVSGKGLIYVNAAFIKMFGYDSEEEMLQIDPAALYHNPADRKRFSQILIKKGSLNSQEVRFRRKDGSLFWGYVNATAQKTADEIIISDGTIRDLTEKKRIEEDLAYSSRFQRLLLRIANKHINVPLEDVGSQIESSLAEISIFIGADRAYIIGMKPGSMQSEQLLKWCSEDKSCNSGQTNVNYVSEYSLIAASNLIGKTFYVEKTREMQPCTLKDLLLSQQVATFLSVPMMDADHCIGAIVFERNEHEAAIKSSELKLLKAFADMMANINLRIERQQERSTLIEELSQQNDRLKEYSHITSHNIRSSVSRIHALGKFLQEDRLNEDFFEKLMISIRNLDQTIQNTNHLLHFEQTHTEKAFKSYNIIKSIQRIIDDIKETVNESKNVEITVFLEKCKTHINTIPAYTDSIIHNLVSNAIKYGVSPLSNKIEITLREVGNNCELIVRDFGIGMDLEKYADKLFKLGGRLHDDSRGQGLGLYMTKRQVEALGGEIKVVSQLYKGTTFTVSLPMEKV